MKTDNAKEKIALLNRKLAAARTLFILGLDKVMPTKFVADKNPYLQDTIKQYDKIIKDTK